MGDSRDRLAAFEAWLSAAPTIAAAVPWRAAGLDLWPLFSTCLASLAIQVNVGMRKGGIGIGSLPWQAVVAARLVLEGARRLTPPGQLPLPADRLGGLILYCGSAIHTRSLDGILVAPPIDVPATLMRRAGYEGVLWLDDVPARDTRLADTLSGPARGVAETVARGVARHWPRGVGAALGALPGFGAWCADAGRLLGLSPWFVSLWLARQTGLAAAASATFGEVFDARGAPAMLVLVNGGFATTAGLVRAARARGVPVVEVQHGALSTGTAIAPGSEPHFSRFDTAPEAFIGWERAPYSDGRCLAVGPIGLHLPAVLADAHERDGPGHAKLRSAFAAQRDALAAHAAGAGADREVLVSLQPGDDGRWVTELARTVPPGTLFWLRRHGADLMRGLAPDGGLDHAMVETRLATAALLPILLERAHVNLTRFSALTLEAAATGIATLATDPYAGALYGDRVPRGLLALVPDPGALPGRLAGMLRQSRNPRVVGLPDPSDIVRFLADRIRR